MFFLLFLLKLKKRKKKTQKHILTQKLHMWHMALFSYSDASKVLAIQTSL